ncbi:hypothetical protein [Myxococcus sp. SDU36]|uniref:hypothetical protein n=1 Tax=Myxococcus sp. SDU36 TaxID=2831967 RepID=UPI002543B108|nr:hypothetical protein [Myxococcus sp. SDU36]WIG94589.1 hypothetical protein KGD87_29340 [Myxococcus sp. SDU36]
MFMRWAIVLLLVLPGAGWAEEVADPEDSAGEEEPASPATHGSRSQWANLLRMEATSLTLLPRRGVGRDEGFVQLEPRVVVRKRGVFNLSLGAPVRLRLWGGGEGAGSVRKADWDALSDWGQVVRAFTVGGDAPNSLWMGALESYTLLSGHLVRRYNNRGNPDYHPAGAVVTGKLGPAYVEAFASDVLGARLVGAEVALDVPYLLFGRPPLPLQYLLSLSAVHDWGRAGGASKPLTLAHLDGTAMLVRRRSPEGGFELQLLGGWGGRPGEGGAWGAVAGVGVDALTATVDLRARLEGRVQRGGFRQGAFGPDYELARFQVAGPASLPQAEAPFPEGYSAYGEVILSWDAERLGTLARRHLRLTMGAEAFSWGRVDVEGRLEAQAFHRSLTVAVGGLAMGTGQPAARYLVSGEARWRFLGGKLYAVGQGGTLLFPTAEGTLRPGAFAAVGLGVDHVR